MPQKVHYTWIGPVNPNGHDVDAVLKMAKQINLAETQLYFWCVDAQAKKYKETFKNTSVIVKPIQSSLKERLENSRAQRMNNLLEKLLRNEGRGDVRDRVTLKEAFVFLLLGLEGGYELDSNVAPNIDGNINFPDYNTFRMLAIHYPVKIFRDADVGIMYSPHDDPSHALAAFDYFMDKIEEIENFKEILSKDDYKAAVLDIVIDAAFHNHYKLDFWFARHLGGNFPILLHLEKPRGIMKHYANSHGAADRKPIPALHLAIIKNNIEEVKKLLDEGADINEITETEKYKNITPINAAYFYGRTEIGDLLRSRGADINITLMQKQNDERCNISKNDAGVFSPSPSPNLMVTPATPRPADNPMGERQLAFSPSELRW